MPCSAGPACLDLAQDDPGQRLISSVASGVREGVAPDPAALRFAVRILADRLATRHPGRSVEVRIPPYAAVQCIPGPRHTRGTPPNVVETDPITFVGLACGFVDWDAPSPAGGCGRAGSGADLRPYLPLDVQLGRGRRAVDSNLCGAPR